MKVLSIGNSFSQDAHKWLHKLAKQNGIEMETVNLYIGGCCLKQHWDYYVNNDAFYDLERNGNEGERKITISEALEMDKWDVVTLQQVSGRSGIPETYEPYLTNLAEVIKKAQPQAKLYIHQTWAYEIDSDHDEFINYHNDQQEMLDCIKATTEKKAESINASLIPTGTAIQKVRENIAEFDYKNGGLSLCRDGFHLSFDYGRYIAAATWILTLTGKKIKAAEFEDFDVALLEKIVASMTP